MLKFLLRVTFSENLKVWDFTDSEQSYFSSRVEEPAKNGEASPPADGRVCETALVVGRKRKENRSGRVLRSFQARSRICSQVT